MIKKILKFLLFIAILLAIGSFIFVNSKKPQYSGELNIENLNDKVTVYFDEIGVPHIYAQNQQDAYIALGYLHAQDRLWQMELIRRISAGRLSEIFGKDMIDTDKFFKGIGVEEAADRSIKNLDTTTISYKLTNAYLNGINQFIDKGSTPIEFSLIGIEKENYTIKDIYNVFGYMGLSFAQAHKTDPLMTNLKNKLGYHYMVELGLKTEPNSTMIGNYNPNVKSESKVASVVNNILDKSVVPPFIGSNSWVVGEKKTKNKKVILANDPHIAFSQPAVWYQSHIVTPNFEIYGFNLALTPFPLLGHNHDYAYGITLFENDDNDFYSEKDGQKYKNRKYTIKVKDDQDVEFQVKVGRHGPVMNDFIDLIDSEENIAMDWVYTKFDNDMLHVSYEISHANSLDDFKKGVEKIHAPGLNMMYGDAKGNIAWFAAAKLYSRENDANTKYILESENDKISYLDFNQNPQAINPPWNYVYSANNQPKAIDNRLYPGYYLAEDRAKRIVNLVQPKNDFTKEEMQEMIMDVTSPVVLKNINTVLKNISKVNLSDNEKEAIEILKSWKGDYKSTHTAPTIYNKFIYNFLKNTFADEMGEEGFKQFLKTHLYKRQIAKQIQNRKSIWWDNTSTKEIKENRDEIFTSSFHEAITDLENQLGEDVNDWTWDKALSITHRHAFDKVEALKSIFNVGPFITNGGNEVINNQLFQLDGSGKYEVKGGPSTRRIIDFSDIENGIAILPTGQSGNVFSKHYKDQAQKYLDGEFYKMMLNKEEIEASKDVLVLKSIK